ncbi:hypothetical protein GCM10011594_39820 [Nakamurella endophytica]|uniref:Uncharacterized protein n=1 Tax=Nakamurella endophytica TaxID=1748367 RepID=A0A917TCR2_9ACTN|nr:hypothetical protein GCM10011594_39820 [Nakamurella endophytica]
MTGMHDDRVRYHGSLTEQHGPAVRLGYCPCPDCRDLAGRSRERATGRWDGDGLGDERFRLVLPDGSVLSHVRAYSFTDLSAAAPCPGRAAGHPLLTVPRKRSGSWPADRR